MIKETFQTETEYFSFIRTALVFMHLRAYNGGCFIWKKEHLPYIEMLDMNTVPADKKQDFKAALEVYKRAEKEYGEDTTYWKEVFSLYSPSKLLSSFGVYYNGDDFEKGSYVLHDLDIDLSKLERTNTFPKTFPVVTCIERGDKYRGLIVKHIYLNDLKNKPSIGDFSWLGQNVRDFWNNGEGYVY